MLYDYECTKCGNIQEEEAKVAEFKEFEPTCNKCGGKCKYHFTPTVIQFALKDGPSGSWPSKGNRFKNYRAKQSEAVKKRQRERYGGGNKLIPNYRGQRTEDWREAQSMAMQDKDNPDSLATASTYNEQINKEKAAKTK